MRVDIYKRAEKDNIKDKKTGLLADMECNHKHKAIAGVCLNDGCHVSCGTDFSLKGRINGGHHSPRTIWSFTTHTSH